MAAKTTFRYTKKNSIIETPSFPSVDLTESEMALLFKFYIVEPPITRQSSKSVTLAERGWVGGFEKSGLKTKLDAICNLSDVICEPSSEAGAESLAELFSKRDLLDGPVGNLSEERAVITGKGESNSFLRLLRHIRNCFAHGNFLLQMNADEDEVFVMEDRETGKNPNVTARMVLKKETIIAWAETIMRGTDGERRTESSNEIRHKTECSFGENLEQKPNA